MAFEKGKEKTGGRQKGSENKINKTVKEVVLAAFNQLQEDPKHNILEFAKKHPRDFYLIASKLIPTEIKGNVETTLITVVPPNKR